MAEVFHSFNMRSLKGSIFTIKKQNLVLWGAGIIAIAATILVLQVPFIAENVFSLQSLNVAQFFTAVGIAFAIIPIVEIVKIIQRLIDKKRK
jgi:Ca2+-transporting ATPase